MFYINTYHICVSVFYTSVKLPSETSRMLVLRFAEFELIPSETHRAIRGFRFILISVHN